ncbi:hypothetical protein C6568_01690 [Melaminivora suipulveris]|uniref:Uncharacterized protein n=1 Tax=Melaminivora suipulveris TaxID=2109913 RepID=A0A2R3Q8K2_9BURK|nr:hypothetical protein [Melaminivora suipulveris]AVO48108.1 hypothetical protein C6568_01690 [Melaminivora suipulveris]
MAFALIAWSSSLSALSRILRPRRRAAAPDAVAGPVREPSSPRSVQLAPELVTIALPDADRPQQAADVQSAPRIMVQAPSACHWSLPSGGKLAAPRARAAAVPLRVIRRGTDGEAARLVISGRMADVCAELDRLVLH